MRKTTFENGEFYHIYNRGVDKRNIFISSKDTERFLTSMNEFNCGDPIGSLYEKNYSKKKFGGSTSKKDDNEGGEEKLVNIIAFCLNPNHFHFLLEQVADDGIKKFMHRLGTGYTMYFNERLKRSGALFQGRFKAVHVNNNNYLLHLSAYINLNYEVHGLGGSTSKSSWGEYMGEMTKMCVKDVVTGQFSGCEDYRIYASESVKEVVRRRAEDKEYSELLIE